MPTSRAREKVTYRCKTALTALHVDPEKALAAQFASFSTTIQNRLDNDGSGSPIALNGSLEAQVERALSQALRQTAPPGATGAAGSVATALAATGSGQPATGAGLSPGLSTAQAVLVGEAAVIQPDMLAALDALQPLSPEAVASDIAAYRNIVRAEVLALTTEFARPDQPRPIRVRVLFGGLLGWAYAPDYPPYVVPPPTGDLAALNYLLGLEKPVVECALTEDQLALQGVVTANAARLFDLWVAYQYAPPLTSTPTKPVMWGTPDPNKPRMPGIGGVAAVKSAVHAANIAAQPGVPRGGKSNTAFDPPPPPPPPPFSFSERMIRADLLLPVLSHDGDQVAGALDAVGFGPGAQETVSIPSLTSTTDTDLGTAKLPIQMAQQQLPMFGLTVKDVLDWAADLAGGAGYDLLRQAGQLGLDLLADQADELFWIVAAIIKHKSPPELGDAQVQIELRSLARDLSALADLSN